MTESSTPTVVRDKLAFDHLVDGFRFVATYLVEPEGDALIEIFRGEELVRSTLWPAYKVWNVAAHAHDIAADLHHGLAVAGSTGLGGNVYDPSAPNAPAAPSADAGRLK